MRIKKAVITAAGWGTRFLPATKSQPKEMLPIFKKPLIQYSVEEAIACGAETIVIVTALGKRAIEDYFDRAFELEHMLEQRGENKLAAELRRLSNMADICYVRQKEQLGLGHALLTARGAVGDEPFLLLLPDDLFEHPHLVLNRMQEIYESQGRCVLAVKRVPEEEVSRYGIIEPRKVTGRTYEIVSLQEKPRPEEAASNMAIMGRYVLVPQIFDVLKDTPPGRNGEIQLTDALQTLLRQQPIYGHEFEGERYDAGTPLGWLQTTIIMALKDPDAGPALRDYIHKLLGSAHSAQAVSATAAADE